MSAPKASSPKDKRRPDLIIPYQEPPVKESSTDMTSTMNTTLPMAAMFTRNKYISWTSLVFAVQSWLSESEETRKSAGQPAYMTVGMSLLSMGVVYLPLFMPQPGVPATGTSPAAAAPIAV